MHMSVSHGVLLPSLLFTFFLPPTLLTSHFSTHISSILWILRYLPSTLWDSACNARPLPSCMEGAGGRHAIRDASAPGN